MKVLDIINEAPIEDWNALGDWTKNSSFGKNDRRIINNPRAVEKIKNTWLNVGVPFNVYVVNSAEANRYLEVGQVTMDWLKENMPNTLPQMQFKDNAVNIIYTNNRGDQRVPFTAWIMAHRFGHAVYRYKPGLYTPKGSGPQRYVGEMTEARDTIFTYISDIFSSYGISDFPSTERTYDSKIRASYSNGMSKLKDKPTPLILRNFYNIIGNFRSAREGKIRNETEFVFELLAQYMLTRKITFRPAPKMFRVSTGGFRGRDYYCNPNDLDYINNSLESMATDLEHTFDNLLRNCIGKIFVM